MVRLPDPPRLSMVPTVEQAKLQTYFAELTRIMQINLDEIEAKLKEIGGENNG